MTDSAFRRRLAPNDELFPKSQAQDCEIKNRQIICLPYFNLYFSTNLNQSPGSVRESGHII